MKHLKKFNEASQQEEEIQEKLGPHYTQSKEWQQINKEAEEEEKAEKEAHNLSKKIDKKYSKKNSSVYVVHGPDGQIFGVRYEKSDAKKLQKEEQYHLEMSGSRGSAGITKTTIK